MTTFFWLRLELFRHNNDEANGTRAWLSTYSNLCPVKEQISTLLSLFIFWAFLKKHHLVPWPNKCLFYCKICISSLAKFQDISSFCILQVTCTSNLDCTLEEVRRYGDDLRNIGTTQNISLVIDGNTLDIAMSPDLQQRFIELTKHCRSVLCCRVTPLQKSAVVKLVRDKLKVMTLAVGKLK